jgi:hypothetical protein
MHNMIALGLPSADLHVLVSSQRYKKIRSPITRHAHHVNISDLQMLIQNYCVHLISYQS